MRVKKKRVFRTVLLLVVFVFTVLFGLGYFRFRVLLLTNQLSANNDEINILTAEESQLDLTLKGLISPIKLYSYCKDKLGMYAAKPEAVHLPMTLMAADATEPKKEWRSSLFAFFGFSVN